MADYFAVSEENLTDTHLVNDLRAEDAALVEPLACVFKGISLANLDPENQRAAVIGLGSMGLLHMHVLPRQTLGFDLEPSRVHWARRHGLQAAAPDEAQTANVVFVCPGSQAAFDQALKIVEPGGTILNFAPLGPGQSLSIPQRAYFLDLKIVNSYSCGPGDVAQALAAIRAGAVKAQQICSHFIRLPELPTYYKKMKAAEILKPMVRWD
jgi:L-iditol 2-dehydrogenase